MNKQIQMNWTKKLTDQEVLNYFYYFYFILFFILRKRNKIYSLWLTTRNKFYITYIDIVCLFFFIYSFSLIFFFHWNLRFLWLLSAQIWFYLFIYLAFALFTLLWYWFTPFEYFFCCGVRFIQSVIRSNRNCNSICFPFFSLSKNQTVHGPDSPSVPAVDATDADKSTVASASTSDQPTEQ